MATGSSKTSKNDSTLSYLIAAAIIVIWIATHQGQTPTHVTQPAVPVVAQDATNGSGAGASRESSAHSSGDSAYEDRRPKFVDGSNTTSGHYTAGVPEQMPVPTTPTYVPVYTPPTPVYTAPTPVYVPPSVPVDEPIEVHPF